VELEIRVRWPIIALGCGVCDGLRRPTIATSLPDPLSRKRKKPRPAAAADERIGVPPPSWKPVLLVTAVALAASLAGLFNGYAADDLHLIAEDPRAHSFADPASLFAAPYWPAPFNRDLYRPLATSSFAVQWTLGGGSPLVFRVVSYLMYAATSLAVLALARRFLPEMVAVGVALLFAAHPVHVEAVAQGVNQGEQLVGLISILAVIRYLDIRRRGWPDLADWLMFSVAYVLAYLFKENALVMPGLFLAVELTAVQGVPRERVRRLAPGFLAMSALGGIFLAVRAGVVGSFAGSFTADALVGQGPWGRLITMLQVVPQWVRLLVWPAHLHGDYSLAVIEQATTVGAIQLLGVALLGGAAVLAWLTHRSAPAVAFGLLWCAVTLFPVSNVLLPTGIVLSERSLYLPSVGFLLAGGALGARYLTLEPHRSRMLALAVGGLVIAGVARSAVRHRDWKDHFTFWETTTVDTPLSYRGHYAYGELLGDRGDYEGSLRHLRRAITLNPAAYWVETELGDVYQKMGDCESALRHYAASLKVRESQVMVRLSRMSCLLQLGRLEEARAEADAAERLREDGRQR
jgi:hypothetical protein